jgi:predicted MPP superfamily phosphohydrolase
MLMGGVANMLSRPVRWIVSALREKPTVPSPAVARSPSEISRRKLLANLAVTAPPMALAAAVGVSLVDFGRFRINRTTLAFTGWPRDLDGFSIAIVADIHAGLFTTSGMIEDIRNRTNALRPDMIVLPGDLINFSLADLPNTLDIVRGMFAPRGVYLITGNHDVIQSEIAFITNVRNAGIHLLHDQSAVIRSPGKTPFELLGIRWSDEGKDGWDNSIRNVTRKRHDPTLFPILMAHHPHAWDSTPPFGIPLTISGHTHGGQLMLTKNIGAGPMRFRYWSGVYNRPTESGSDTLLISNGVGNWFPLRVNAPPEVVLLTMRSA